MTNLLITTRAGKEHVLTVREPYVLIEQIINAPTRFMKLTGMDGTRYVVQKAYVVWVEDQIKDFENEI